MLGSDSQSLLSLLSRHQAGDIGYDSQKPGSLAGRGTHHSDITLLGCEDTWEHLTCPARLFSAHPMALGYDRTLQSTAPSGRGGNQL